MVCNAAVVELTTTSEKPQCLRPLWVGRNQPAGLTFASPARKLPQCAIATVAGCITFFTTYSPILRPISWPTRVENR
jgi:hypothetical protein